MNKYRNNTMVFFFIAILIKLIISTAVVLGGGQLTMSGSITNTQVDFMVNYTSNVKWLAIIFSPDEVNADVHLLLVDANNVAIPVKARDAHLDDASSIVIDNVNNIQPSITAFQGDISNGLSIAYNRDIATGDSQDLRFYLDSVIQVCFISSLSDFQGNGYEKGHQKICSFFSLHSKLSYYQDRLLGNFGATTLFGGSNLTIYASQSTDGDDLQPWLFVSILHKQQGLSPFSGKWIGITYEDSMSNVDVGLIQYSQLNFLTEVHARDMYATNSSFGQDDSSYIVLQGGNDVKRIAWGYESTQYLLTSYKRKYSTGDVNRDKILEGGNNTFCVILGDNIKFTNFVQTQRLCLPISIKIPYNSNFRVVTSTSGTTVTEYTPPSSDVKVVKKFNKHIQFLIGCFLMLLMIF